MVSVGDVRNFLFDPWEDCVEKFVIWLHNQVVDSQSILNKGARIVIVILIVLLAVLVAVKQIMGTL